MMRQCFNASHVALFDELTQYMRDIGTRKVLESTAMHALTVHLRTGRTFCRALALVAQLIKNELEHKLALRTGGDDGMASGWKPTYDFLRHRDVEGRCAARLEGKQVYTGPLSTVVDCLTDRRKLAVAHAIVSRFAADEARQ